MDRDLRVTPGRSRGNAVERPAGLGRSSARGVHVGPSDLILAVGGRFHGDPERKEVFDAATAKLRREQGFRFITIASDLTHLEQAARGHLETARA